MDGDDDDNPHPTDAYELGREAVARLKEHNEELSFELPNALETLFSDTDFQQAIVVSGVVTSQRQLLFPVASYSLQKTEPQTSGTSNSGRVLTRRQQQQHQLISSTPTPSIPMPSAIEGSPSRSNTTTGPCLQLVEVDNVPNRESEPETRSEEGHTHARKSSDESSESEPDENPTTPKRRRVQPDPETEEPLFVEIKAAPDESFEEVEEAEEVEESNCGLTEEQEPVDSENLSKLCISCNEVIEADLNEENEELELGEKRKQIRDMLWISLGINKYYDTSDKNFPFCSNCESKLNRMFEICHQVKELEAEFNSSRDEICKGLISRNVNMTQHVSNMPNIKWQIEKVKSRLFKRMKNEYDNITPGSKLIEASNSGGSRIGNSKSSKRKSNEEEDDDTDSNDDDNPSAEDELKEPRESIQTRSKKWDCRFCNKCFPGSHLRDIHERNSHLRNKEMVNCEVCGKEIKKTRLTQHMKYHTKTYKCTFCLKMFSTKAYLDLHVLRHKGFRQFHCTICPNQSYYLKKEMDAHFCKRHPGMIVEDNIRRLKPPTADNKNKATPASQTQVEKVEMNSPDSSASDST